MTRRARWIYTGTLTLTAVLLLFAVLFFSGATASGESDSPPNEGSVGLASSPGISDEEALAIDYAATFDVDMTEARRRANLLLEVEPTLDSIRQIASDTLAGLYIEHQPNLLVHLRLTAVPNSALRSVIEESPVPVKVHSDAVLSLSETRRRLDSVRAGLATAVPGFMGVGTDERTGAVVLHVFIEDGPEETEATKSEVEQVAASLTRETGLSVRIDYLSGPVIDMHTYGGTNLEQPEIGGENPPCTGGFVVKETGTNALGLLTAAHCNNELFYLGFGSDGHYGLTLEDEEFSSTADAEWNSHNHVTAAEFYANSTSSRRTVTSVKTHSSMIVGGLVCHRGYTTGYSCGQIDELDYQPPSAICPVDPSPCDDTWVKVVGTGLDCGSGDSGGPFFSGNTAYGILKAGMGTNCDFAVFMAVDPYLDPLGVEVLVGS